ncbi:MAG: bifunctional phosphopantothenoylcysteine decarboxylase/phosphopantothenate--cysteine ligase CoaBC [Candidatus Sumerlaeia bacterium]|nr:bifunctional phosphopantothenoylcysteine decarboxylase/phosphopantothenate--cysteine ligase CoaBC [Candidatus Sumerlaeia bacterium]
MAAGPQDNQTLAGRKIILGISGGIAAYKAADLARQLRKRGAELRVVMTRNAAQFVSPLTFATLTQAPVCVSLWKQPDAWSMEHISNARWGDLLLVAPATANVIAKFAHGIADDALTTLYLAWRGPVVIAPAMNTAMFEHPAYQANEAVLRQRGHAIVGPESGELACGEEGAGRLASLDAILAAVETHMSPDRPLEGLRVLITAGPTREFLDPIRFLSNPSSGKMGFALAEQASRMGAEVTLIAGPVTLPTPSGVERVDVVSAQAMHDAVMERCGQADILVFAAAVSDFAPERAAESKIKKREWARSLQLRRTPDVARAFGQVKRPDQVSVGFAADTEDVVQSARMKLREKRFDFVLANPVRGEEQVFGSEHNRGWLVGPSGRPRALERMTKSEMARHVLQHAVEVLRRKR